MAISINQISTGMGLQLNGDIFLVLKHQHVKPGKGAAFAKVKLRNFKSGQVLEKTIKPADKPEEIQLEDKKLQFLYQSGEIYHFMDSLSFEELQIQKNFLDGAERFLQDGLEVKGLFFNNDLLNIELPIFITAEVTYTEPGFKGDSTATVTKPATIDTGTSIQVPTFINIEDKIKIDTRSGEYVERVKG